MFVSTNAVYLEEDYVMEHKPISRVVLEELLGARGNTPDKKDSILS